MRRTPTLILSIVAIILINILVHYCYFRLDLTQDKRYSVSAATQSLLRAAKEPIAVTLYLDGKLNSGFMQLRGATEDMLRELSVYADIRLVKVNPNQLSVGEQQQLQTELFKSGLHPTAIYERESNGKSSQTIVYPYARLQYGDKKTWVNLLLNTRGLSGAENLNHSIENLEYAFASALHTMMQTERGKVAFIEGHGELPAQATADAEQLLSKWFDVYRGEITAQADCLDPFCCIIIPDPQLAFPEEDKYIIDQYIMRGGRALWLTDGVRFSEQVLTDEGFTPIMPLELNLTDLFFRYGVRVNPHLVEDLQCLPIPVDVSQDPEIPQYQAMPWYYAPLLLTSQANAITRGVSQVSATFASDIDIVGENDSLRKEILLATSTDSYLTGAPAEVDLSDLQQDTRLFNRQYLPVAVLVEGTFPSLFAHRLKPEKVSDNRQIRKTSATTKQVFVASGSIIHNDLQQGQPLPMGYDRYSRMQFGNRDFIANAVLYLADNEGLIALREKSMPLRLLNDKRIENNKTIYQITSTLVPLLLLAVIGVGICLIRRKRYIY